jgi:hypothetical protein
VPDAATADRIAATLPAAWCTLFTAGAAPLHDRTAAIAALHTATPEAPHGTPSPRFTPNPTDHAAA